MRQLEARAPRDGRPDDGMALTRDGQLFGGLLALARVARDEAAI